MRTEAEHRTRITDYYNAAQVFYEHMWYGKSLGLHYGFWTGVSSRHQAITRENEVLANLVGVKAGDKVLDAGSGVEGSGIWLAKKRGAEVVGVNIVHNQLKIGKTLGEKNNVASQLAFVEGDFQELPFQENSFDVVWSLESIEHATDTQGFIEEAFRVLKPGGKIVIAATFKGRETLSEEETKQIQVGADAAGCFKDFQTAQQAAKLMQIAGFEEINNLDKTNDVMNSSREMAIMCRLGLPGARIAAALHLTSPILVLNNQWGTYQEGLFQSGATSYNVLVAEKPL